MNVTTSSLIRAETSTPPAISINLEQLWGHYVIAIQLTENNAHPPANQNQVSCEALISCKSDTGELQNNLLFYYLVHFIIDSFREA